MKHGTSGYWRGCRCAECTRATREYSRARRAERNATGLGRLVLAADARAHIAALVDHGVSVEHIARSSGLASFHVYEIQTGRVLRVRRTTEDAIRSIPMDALEDAQIVAVWRARRLVDAMRSGGFPDSSIHAALGFTGMRRLELNRRRFVYRRTFDKLTVLYKLLARQGIVPASVLEEVGA